MPETPGLGVEFNEELAKKQEFRHNRHYRTAPPRRQLYERLVSGATGLIDAKEEQETMYRWLVFIHVLAALLFALAHGTSAKVTFKLRRETDPDRLASWLSLSEAYMTVVYVALLVILLAGIALGVLGRWWGQAWLWVALGLTVAIIGAMASLAGNPMRAMRESIGAPPGDDRGAKGATMFRPALVAAIGLGGLTLVIWLMVVKPF